MILHMDGLSVPNEKSGQFLVAWLFNIRINESSTFCFYYMFS
jgi:hypothetical protein